ncbi:hypothetical protein PF010_g3335 [Phytophthora fragariae]|uniref:Secreted protein n=1 Tax=Phytophthora fragariae TaxID=53985 RepID=A0A6A3TWE1_9STRA|nr:hypothetical protein PF003_g24743 [Phytophthora fragariae]KAE9132032.1 hypothetical protein PF010_g3335 [Phytophthora fragariae]KAE9138376.1 hypothetical protein PF007_g1425 [Phytophthora fragariae]KAE9154848.1 hypothetical protein PF006_g1125 [Phytophthora fragariae]KAE9257125.1 hypothetical protein PF002_g1336 [Phytophthora fragariae]
MARRRQGALLPHFAVASVWLRTNAAVLRVPAQRDQQQPQGESCRMRCMHGLPSDCVNLFRFVLPSPAQLAAAAAAAVPRHHHRPRAWGRRHRASWVRHKVSRAVRAACNGLPTDGVHGIVLCVLAQPS